MIYQIGVQSLTTSKASKSVSTLVLMDHHNWWYPGPRIGPGTIQVQHNTPGPARPRGPTSFADIINTPKHNGVERVESLRSLATCSTWERLRVWALIVVFVKEWTLVTDHLHHQQWMGKGGQKIIKNIWKTVRKVRKKGKEKRSPSRLVHGIWVLSIPKSLRHRFSYFARLRMKQLMTYKCITTTGNVL